MSRQALQDAANTEGLPPSDNHGARRAHEGNPPEQAEVNRQLGQKLFECHKLMTELQNVETCLLWFRDELPPALLSKNTPGLLGQPQAPIDNVNAAQAAATAAQPPTSSLFGVPADSSPGGMFANAAPFSVPFGPPLFGRPANPSPFGPPAGTPFNGGFRFGTQSPHGFSSAPTGHLHGFPPPSFGDLDDAKEYMQAANIRERFMRVWRQQEFPANNIPVPRYVARAKARLSIPQDPWQSFPDGEESPPLAGNFGAGAAASRRCGHQLHWEGTYAVQDWQHVVTYLEKKTEELQQAIGAQFR